MVKYRFFILTAFIIALSSSAYSADTIIIRDTVYVFDSTKAVATSVAELKAEFYDRALQGVERDKSFITLILSIIGIVLLIIAGSAVYSITSNRQAREDVKKVIEQFEKEYEVLKKKTKEAGILIEGLKNKTKHIEAQMADVKEHQKVRPEEIDKLIDSDDAKEVIPIYEKELAKLEKTNELDILPPLVHKNAGLSYLRLKEYSKALFALKRFLNSKPGDTETLFYSAVCLDQLELYDQAAVQYSMSITSDSDNSRNFNDASYNNWGTALGSIFDKWKDASLIDQAIDKFKQALAVNEKYDQPYYNWGNALIRLYDIRKDVSLLERAIVNFKQAIAINDNYYAAYDSWGTSLSRLYDVRKDETLLDEAIEKFKKAVAINEESEETYYNWGIALFKKYKIDNKVDILDEAIEKFEKEIEINPDSADPYYVMACFRSLQGQKEQMLSALEKAVRLDVKYKFIAMEDEDFEAYKDDPEFLALVKPAKDDKKSKRKKKN